MKQLLLFDSRCLRCSGGIRINAIARNGRVTSAGQPESNRSPTKNSQSHMVSKEIRYQLDIISKYGHYTESK